MVRHSLFIVLSDVPLFLFVRNDLRHPVSSTGKGLRRDYLAPKQGLGQPQGRSDTSPYVEAILLVIFVCSRLTCIFP